MVKNNMLEDVCYDIETDVPENWSDSKYLKTIENTYKSGYNTGIYHGFLFGFTIGLTTKLLLDIAIDYKYISKNI
jgi:tetrahydromethanopterin S-methyltransferase subunit B